MPTATVTPKYINGAKPDSHYGSINCDGTYYGFDVRKISPNDFSKGTPVTIEYTTSERSGKTFYNITRIVDHNRADNDHAPSGGTYSSGSNSSKSVERDETITRLAIAKSCIEANQGPDVANRWLAWVKSGAPF